jgi:preprotein translocase subunit YajC
MVPRQGGNPGVIFVIQILAVFAIIYFLIIRPQRQEQQKHQAMLAAVKKGDEIVTSGGVIGTVIHAEPERLTIRSGESTRLVIERGRVARLIPPNDGQPKEKGE